MFLKICSKPFILILLEGFRILNNFEPSHPYFLISKVPMPHQLICFFSLSQKKKKFLINIRISRVIYLYGFVLTTKIYLQLTTVIHCVNWVIVFYLAFWKTMLYLSFSQKTGLSGRKTWKVIKPKLFWDCFRNISLKCIYSTNSVPAEPWGQGGRPPPQ